MTTSDSDILIRVRPHIVDALGVEEDEVVLDAGLMDDLGAESIDFLDIFFRVEREFGIKIDGSASSMMSDDRYVRDGVITELGLEEVRRRLPNVDLTLVEETRSVQDIQRGFTVDSIIQMVKARLAENVTTG
jgi:acyl carrier protein